MLLELPNQVLASGLQASDLTVDGLHALFGRSPRLLHRPDGSNTTAAGAAIDADPAEYAPTAAAFLP